MMIEINVILSLFFFCLCSVFDIIVYNEEILLTLCFLSFLFYCFNVLSESIASSFDSRASKFEQDLLTTFDNKKSMLIMDFNSNLKLENYTDKFSILMAGLINYFSDCKTNLQYKPTWFYFQGCLSKLNELTLINKNFIAYYQQNCIVQLLYSLILKKSKNNLKILAVSKVLNSNWVNSTELKFI
jgi:hypothetical protein